MSARLDEGLDREDLRLDAQEDLILDVTEAILEAMEDRGTSRADLARKLDVTRAHVTQVLSGERNMTLRTLADFAFAVDRRVGVHLRPLRSASLPEAPPANVVPLNAAAHRSTGSDRRLSKAPDHGTWVGSRRSAAASESDAEDQAMVG